MFFILNRPLFFCVLNSHWFLRASNFVFPKNRSLFFCFPKQLKLEFMEYTPTARNTKDSLSSTLKNRIVIFISLKKKQQQGNHSSTMVVTQSRSVLSRCCQSCCLTLLQTVCSKVRVTQEIGSHAVLFGRQGIESSFMIKKHNNIENNLAISNKQMRTLRDDHRETACIVEKVFTN